MVLLVWVMLSRCTRKGTIHTAYVTNHIYQEVFNLMTGKLKEKEEKKIGDPEETNGELVEL